MTEYSHIITTLRKIDTTKYLQFDYCDEDNFEAVKYYNDGEVLNFNGTFYKISRKQHFSPLQEIPNILVKHGRHIIETLTV